MQSLLERAEGKSRIVKDLCTVNRVAGVNIVYIAVTAPAVAVCIRSVVFPILRRQKAKCFAVGVASLF